MNSFRYTEEQDQFLRDNVKGISNIELADKFNKKFNLNKTPHQIQNRKFKLGIKSGVNSGRFKKGRIPHNKGKKMTKEQYEKCKGTMFKKGNIPSNRREILSTRIDKRDNGILIKIQDGNLTRNWTTKGRFVYEQTYGKIPDGYVVIFADGNNRNFDLDNLILVSRSEELIMNRNKLMKNDKELTKAGANIARLIDKCNKRKE